MKRYLIFIVLAIVVVLVIAVAIFSNQEESPSSEQEISNSSNVLSRDVNEEVAENRISNILEHSNEIVPDNTNESEISSYSTTIKDRAEGRLTNINITCNTLNNTVIRNGSTFSFNEIVGKPTAERGYQEASVIIDHKTEKGIGGGNCQVSSTLYNAVLAIPSLTIIERHEHGKDVTYVPEGKDAAVSYGSLDFKSRNGTGHDIRIQATTDNQTITIKLIQL